MKKKVGICACYTNHNYGSMLQSFATQKVFESEGFECEMIRYKKKKTPIFLVKQIPRLFNRITISDKKLVISKKINFALHSKAKRENDIREKAFDRFQKKYFTKLSPIYYGYDVLKKEAVNYVGVISGSDQVWSPSALATHFYDLTFVPDNIVKASYASSFGVKKIPSYQIRRTKYYLKRLQFVSVREKSGRKIIKDLIDRDAPVVCDPTFLLTNEKWAEYIPETRLINEPYIFAYFLGPSSEHREAVKEFSKKSGIKIVTIHHMDQYVKADEKFGDIVMSDVGPEEFVNLIRGASYVCTDSFHGTIFSILHNKLFITFNRYNDKAKDSKNSRIDSICEILGLTSRRYHNDLLNEIQKPIDYAEVEKKATDFRMNSLAYIHLVSDAIRNGQND